jgi:hypothetical protein
MRMVVSPQRVNFCDEGREFGEERPRTEKETAV